MKRIAIAIFALTLSAGAQHHQHGHEARPESPSPYSGFKDRGIKALSSQQIADLESGKGMGLAMAAELNGYPGPKHTLELADELALSPEQKAKTESLFASMQKEAKSAGAEVIEAEKMLDELFRSRNADEARVDAAVMAVAHAQGRLRLAHLKYHLAMMQVLTPAQVEAYSKLRGY